MAKDKKGNDMCKRCGYCEHCGRGGQQFYPYYPVPYWPSPYTNPWTTNPYPSWTITTTADTYTIGESNGKASGS